MEASRPELRRSPGLEKVADQRAFHSSEETAASLRLPVTVTPAKFTKPKLSHPSSPHRPLGSARICGRGRNITDVVNNPG